MNQAPITREVCLEYVIESLATGSDPVIHFLFHEVAEGEWITGSIYREIAEIVYQHCTHHYGAN